MTGVICFDLHAMNDKELISEVSVFNTQWTDDAHAHTVDDRKTRRKWSPTEDVILIGAWLNTSKNLVVGDEHKPAAFWKRVAAYFSSSPKLAGLQKREPGHCKQRWQKINEGVCKFVICYNAATKEKSSGQNENDVMKLAHEIFFKDYKVKFTLEHAWRELRHDQKWCGFSTAKVNGLSKKRKFDDQSAQSSTSVPSSHGDDEAMARPIGVKAAKAKAKKSVDAKAKKSVDAKAKKCVEETGNKTLMEFQSMWEIKQKEFALKEKLSKHKLLESLLAKTDTLSEMETALKNKLINDMLAS